MAHSYIPRTDIYRPSYDDARPQTPAPAPPRNQPTYEDADVNRIPVNPRRRNAPRAPSPDPPAHLLDPLISRTTRAYDLVIHYDRDSHGGTRWSREDIDRIHHVGRYLHSDVSDLKQQQKAITEEGKQDAVAIDEIRNRTENLRGYCEQIQDLIKDLERVPLRQRMTRDDNGAQAGEPMDRGYESENARDDDRNRLGGKAVEDEGLSISMYTGQEDEIEMIDPPIDARSATWATTPSRRFA